MYKLLESKYILFGILSLLINAAVSILLSKKNNNIKTGTVIKCLIIENIGLILGAKTLDLIMNYERYAYLINNQMYINILDSGYTFLGAIFGAIISLAIYANATNEDIKQIFNIFIPNLLLIYAIAKIGCFYTGCCQGISISGYILPIQLIETCIYLTIYIIVMREHEWNCKKISSLCIVFGSCRFVIEFFRENTTHMYISISQVLSIIIFIYGLKIKNNCK